MSESSPVISVNNVSRRFILKANTAGDLRERFSSLFKPREKQASGEFWAVRDVSFSLMPGETLGIVGHNGSGKSTMLKMLTGILPPTEGKIQMRGRVGALIEVGAGFHPDLSGRENIYLNGSILGLSRKEITSKFDAIVEFAGLARFIDTPVKRYSSGMYMRLGFSVAAHTDPDILLIDEVLAVGDTQFQRKCLRHLHEFVRQGGTVVFVSHAMGQVSELCKNCIWLDHGEARFIGPTAEAIDQYMAVVDEREDAEFKRTYPAEWEIRETERIRLAEEIRREQEEAARRQHLEEEARLRELEEQRKRRRADPSNPLACHIRSVTLKDDQGDIQSRLYSGQSVQVVIEYDFGRSLPNPIFGVDILREDGMHMFTTSNYDHQFWLPNLPAQGTLTLDIGMLSLNEGTYRLQVNLFPDCKQPQWWEHPEDESSDTDFYVSSGRFANGCVYMPTKWRVPENVSPVLETETERKGITR